MPTYEYACRDCAQHVEVVQSFSDAPLSTCGLCGGPLRKVFSAAGIIFKGSGYYVTDSRGSARRGEGKGTDDGKASPEAKPAAKAGEGAASSSASEGSSGKPEKSSKPSTSSTSEAKSA